MNVPLHKNARTTPAIRREWQAQPAARTDAEWAERYNLNRHTVAKWRKRDSVAEASHRPHTLQTTRNDAQEALVLMLRETLLRPLDDWLAVTREFINAEVSRSGLSRCLRRHEVPSLKELRAREPTDDKPKYKTFKDYEPGFVHVDVKYLPPMPDEEQRRYLFAAIDRATRWVYVEILPDQLAASATGFLQRLVDQAAFRIRKVLTDNGKEFTDRFCATGERQPTGSHPFDRVCAEHAIEHRLIAPRKPQTHGRIERFNGRIAEGLATTRFDSSKVTVQTPSHFCPTFLVSC